MQPELSDSLMLIDHSEFTSVHSEDNDDDYDSVSDLSDSFTLSNSLYSSYSIGWVRSW